MERVTARLASSSEHKLLELRAGLAEWDLQLLDADEFPAEEGSSFYENAREKALFGRLVGEPEAWVLADDSGIEVASLGGGPGIASARWAGDGNPVAALLDRMQGVEDRRARYVCELVCLSPERDEFRGQGVLVGRLAEALRGSEGFGYDPIFIPEGEERTVAELGNEWKAEHSHRARAAKALLDAIAAVRNGHT
jgi:XTP/dITP diphosphohydrolase